VSADLCRGIRLAHTLGMPAERKPDNDGEPEPDPLNEAMDTGIVHRFTVHRGMAVALVIETRDWYSGLLQAALARARLEGVN
jgi:hypothetical protein